MKTIFLSIFLFISSFSIVYSQNSVYVGTNKYSSTNPWSFTINGYWSQGFATVTVAKKSGGGLIMLSMASFDGTLKGNVMIYLENGSVISCTDRGIKDEVDYKTIGVYYLTSSEMELLKQSDISSIRFSLYQNIYGTKSYTMDNVYEVKGWYNSSSSYKNSTSYDVNNLYK